MNKPESANNPEQQVALRFVNLKTGEVLHESNQAEAFNYFDNGVAWGQVEPGKPWAPLPDDPFEGAPPTQNASNESTHYIVCAGV
jgi:hypothetical protein